MRAGTNHRVGRVLSFFPVVGIGDSPNPSPEGECAPSSFGSGGRGTHAGERGGGRESPFRRGDIHCGTLYIYVLCGIDSTQEELLITVGCTMYIPSNNLNYTE
jgi:hypothetical protein